ncbi:polysaccharide deacetylase family protein [Anaerosinus massiliensis]|uniref:glycoside hydrolase n=1 Tax=Massilibacillus massiliensis TaxID=1806837 RepID=UPI000A6CE30B|nr:glycoside hydrolase [Massilibacillus massiliensis]
MEKDYTARKDRRKKIRTILQCGMLIILIVVSVQALFTFQHYRPYAKSDSVIAEGEEDTGFIALSYFGVERVGSQQLIGVNRLQEHLKALKDLGYVTVTQEDIIAYYQNKKKLPEKSLFLIFEDGRRDTAIFSQKLLEDLNFKATILTYPEKFEKKDPKFLVPEELIDLENTTYWQMGTNGYRLSFINVFDRYHHYLGELDPLQYAMVSPYLGRRYNHYLMDYIRDADGIPKESYQRMKDRISYDYEALRDHYQSSIGYVPPMYILMHSNTGKFGNHEKVSAVNEKWIRELFQMNFNREGFSFNQLNSSIYDLTRMQPQAYWSVNHLLMRIRYDINKDLAFVQGDEKKQKNWDTIEGASEFRDESVILTSIPKERGLLRLKNSDAYRDLKLSVQMKGNKFGLQKVYVRASENLQRFLAVSIVNNVLYVTEQNEGNEIELFKLDLDVHDGKPKLSIAEDEKAAQVRELEARIRYADSVEEGKIYTEQLKNKNLEKVPTLQDGAEVYVPQISVHEKGDRKVSIAVRNNQISVTINDQNVVEDLDVSVTAAGSVYLASAWGGYGWSQRNLADDVYDGIFEKLIITENRAEDGAKENILFDMTLHGFEGFVFNAKKFWEVIINWFIQYL